MELCGPCLGRDRDGFETLAPSKIFLELSGNAGVESKARNWIESIARFGERANNSRPARDQLCGPKCDGFVTASKMSPHREILTQTNLVIQSKPDSDSM